MENNSELGHANVGSYKEVTMKELRELVMDWWNFRCSLAWDTSKPEGTPGKLMYSSKLARLGGWMPKVALKDGLVDTYKWYSENGKHISRVNNADAQMKFCGMNPSNIPASPSLKFG
ncbi:hypothetical protein QQ045_025793 [Rhodiola kirilowii]